jgi:uncharacterized DUF497 family protein
MAMVFEWDETKAGVNLHKHGVAFERAVSVWADPDLVIRPAVARPEPRWMALGTVDGLVLAVVFAQPDADIVRLISARPASRKERAAYAQP